MAFRPEDARILLPGNDRPAETVSLTGRVEKMLFLGSDVIYRVRIDDQISLTVNEYVSELSDLRNEESDVDVFIPKGKLLFFNAKDGSRIK